jgi:hypothetical protein
MNRLSSSPFICKSDPVITRSRPVVNRQFGRPVLSSSKSTGHRVYSRCVGGIEARSGILPLDTSESPPKLGLRQYGFQF